MPRLPRRRTPAAPLTVVAPEAILEVANEGIVPLTPGGDAQAARLRVAIVIPEFRNGSGGHSTIAHLVRGLEAAGHECSLWVEDATGRHAGQDDAEVAADFLRFFGPVDARVHARFDAWDGADVAVATGWQTVHRVLRLPGAHARAYLVQDHEPDCYGASAERLWAEQTYRLGLHCIAASPWLARVLRERYGASATHFDLGVDHDTYRPLALHRQENVVVLYARAVTPRRAVPLGLLAAAELQRRRPEVRVGLFGEAREVVGPAGLRTEHLGVLDHGRLARVYNDATVGLSLSMTNPSLIPTEMMACALPCVELRTEAMVETFGADGPLTLAEPDPLTLADAVERLLYDVEERAHRARAGLEYAAGRTWPAAAEQVEHGLRAALRATG